jgi:outer membrane receptor protein involved in Fe transport
VTSRVLLGLLLASRLDAAPADSLASPPVPPPHRELRRLESLGSIRQMALIRDLPWSVSALSADAMRDLAVRDARDLTRPFAGVLGDPADADRAAVLVRGLAPTSDALTLHDGSHGAHDLGTSDPVTWDHVELLRGPLDAVFGATGETGGALHARHRMPMIEPERTITLGGDLDGRVRGTLGVSGPVGQSRATWRVDGAADRLREARTPGHDGTRMAIAPVLVWPISLLTTLTVQAQHVARVRTDDPGLPFAAAILAGPRTTFLGARDAAAVRTSTTGATLTLTHEPEGELRLRERLTFERARRSGPESRVFTLVPGDRVLLGRRDLAERSGSVDSQSEAVLRFLTGGWEHQGVLGFELSAARFNRDTSAFLTTFVPVTGRPATAVAASRPTRASWRQDERAQTLYVGIRSSSAACCAPRSGCASGASRARWRSRARAPSRASPPWRRAPGSRGCRPRPRTCMRVGRAARAPTHAASPPRIRACPHAHGARRRRSAGDRTSPTATSAGARPCTRSTTATRSCATSTPRRPPRGARSRAAAVSRSKPSVNRAPDCARR